MTHAPHCPCSDGHAVIWANLAIHADMHPVWWCCCCRAVISDAPPKTGGKP